MHLSLQELARTLRGDIAAGHVVCLGPGHSQRDRSLSVTLSDSAPDGFIVHSFSGDDDIVCKDYVRAQIGLEPFAPNG